jgi:hypothetical protein
MNSLQISKVEILRKGQVAVTPWAPDKMFEFIYRAAAGVEWKDAEGRFVSPSQYMLGAPGQLTPVQRFGQLAGALSSEFGIRPEVSSQTVWVSVPEEVQRAIEQEYGAQPRR